MDSITVLVPCRTIKRNPDFASQPRQEALRSYEQEQFTEEYVSSVRTAVLRRMNNFLFNRTDVDAKTNGVPPGIETFVLHEVIDTPISYANQTNVGAGTPFGLSHGLGQLSIFRPTTARRRKINKGTDSWKEQHTNKNNILFCGASTKPGNGVPLVLIGSKVIAQKAILQIRHIAKSVK
jgi:phytoene dehydrogenase-like protein